MNLNSTISKLNSTNNKSLTNQNYTPLFFRINNAEEEEALGKLLATEPQIEIFDTIYSQLSELVKIKNPQRRLNQEEIANLIEIHLGNVELKKYGVWVYYDWSKKLVHLLDEEEFIEVRTNRNIYKITPEEINILRNKKIGVIGLSVGRSIALTLATERTCGEIRLADFDDIELSNMNRLNVGVHDMCINKAIVSARAIAELDPYIKAICYTDGINSNNIDDFFTKEGNLDVLVEECDGIDIKIISRIKAKSLGIPVVMDTNDKGMIDIERFDLEPDRPIFHGKISDLETLGITKLESTLNNLTLEQKVHYLAKMIDMNNVSTHMKFSLTQMNKTIIGWPQLASAVTLGGAIVTDVCRKMLLNQLHISGRFFVDLDELIK